MMISMTGYGKSTCELSNKVLNIEIRTLNSKQLDISARIPGIYKEKELDMRNLLSQILIRGKIEIVMVMENTETSNPININKSLIKDYYNQLSEIKKDLNIEDNEPLLPVILRIPDVLKTNNEKLDEKEWNKILDGIKEAIKAVETYRIKEGKSLHSDIVKRVQKINSYIQDIIPFEKERIEKLREKLHNNLTEFFDSESIDKNRFEQELIYYLEKMDITEEKVRLQNHIHFFEEVSKNEEISGKKLGFIIQEMNREINTLGSKASHAAIQKIVVQMKDELEKIKEQLMNIL